MTCRSTIRIALAMLLLGTILPAWSQEAVLQGIHARGNAGFTYNRDNSSNIVGQGIGEEVNTDVTGALFRPEFLSWSSSFSYAHSSAAVVGLNTSNTAMAGSFNAMFLPAGRTPLTVTYQRTRVGLGQQGFDSTSNTDRFSIDWRLNLNHLPKIAVRYGKDSNSSGVPVAAFTTTESHASALGISATDTWRGWDWGVGWSRNRTITGAYLFDSAASIEQNYSQLVGAVTRKYLGGRGFLTYNVSRNSNESLAGVFSDLNGSQFSQSASTSLRVTDKLTTFGSFQNYSFSTRGRVAQTQDPSAVVYVINYPASGYAGNGGVIYQLHRHLSVGDTASYSASDVTGVTTEQAANFFTNTLTANANYNWHRIVLNGSYGFGYTQMVTTLDRSFAGQTNSWSASASWTRPWLSLSGGVGVGQGNSGPLPGSYENGRNFNFHAESTRLRFGKLRFRWAMQDRDLLGFTGYLESHRDDWSLTLARRRWEVETGKSNGTGAHQVFGRPATAYEPLPELFGAVLANDTTKNWYVSGTGILSRNLRLRGVYRNESHFVPNNNVEADFKVYEVHLDYRIGKIQINASYGHYANIAQIMTLLHQPGSSSSADRFRFRIMRSFTLF